MKHFAFLLIILSAFALTVQAQYRYRPAPVWIDGADADSAHSWNALHYDLNLRVTPLPGDSVYLNGKVNISLTPTVQGLDTVDVHLVGLQVDSAELNGISCSWTRVDCLLYVALPSPHNPGDTLDLMVAYQGRPLHTGSLLGGVGIFKSSINGGTIYTMADPRGLRNWVPCWDEPWDKATFRQKLTFPNTYSQVVANGIQESIIQGPDSTQWTYYMNLPIATYLVSFCASNYVTFTQVCPGVSIKHYVYPAHLAWAQSNFQLVPEMIQTFSQFYGPYPFSTFGYAEAPTANYSMENQTMVTLLDALINPQGGDPDTYAHELSHHWFGDAVGYLDWPEMWLSEGFATYSQALWHQHLYGMSGYLGYHQIIAGFQSAAMAYENPAHPQPIYNPPMDSLWTPLTYEKGACVLHMLRYEVGDSALFFQILQNYFSLYRYGNASTQDLKAVVEQVTGQDYDWFFNEWVYQAGYPIFEYFATPSPQGISLTVAQTQSPNYPRFRTDADLYCYNGGVSTVHRISIQDTTTQAIQVSLPQTPDSVKLDPVGWILGVKLRRDDLTGPILSDTSAIIADQNGDGFLDPGESGSLSFILQNAGFPTTPLTLTLTSLDPELAVLDSVRTTPALPYYGQYNLSANPFPVMNATGSSSRWVQFRVRISQNGSPLDTLWFSLPVGTPHILLVDDDGGGNAQIKHQQALNALQRVYRTVTYISADSLPPLSNYQAVIWSCGQQTSNTLTSADQTLLQTYLQGGGCLFLSGRGVVPDLRQSSFFQNILHASAPGDSGLPLLQGADPIVQGLHFFAQGDNGVDVAEPDGSPGSGQLLTFLNTSTGVAVKYGGVWKSCVLGFGFEDLVANNPNFATPQQLLGPVLDWFGVDTSAIVQFPVPSLPEAFALKQNYPNPFNGATVASFELRVASSVRLTVWDTAGRLVATLVEGRQSAGTHRVIFEGKGLASGIYIIRMQATEGPFGAGEFNAAKKMVVLK